jgi:hypothetical protein
VVAGSALFVVACVFALRKNPDSSAVFLPPPQGAEASSPAAPAPAAHDDAPAGSAAAPAGHLMYACTVGTVVAYSDRPCPAGAQSAQIVVQDPNTYSAAPVEVGTDSLIGAAAGPAGSGSPVARGSIVGRPDTFSPSAPAAQCRQIEAQIRTIDEAGRRGYSGDEGARMNDQRRRLREQYHALSCSER